MCCLPHSLSEAFRCGMKRANKKHHIIRKERRKKGSLTTRGFLLNRTGDVFLCGNCWEGSPRSLRSPTCFCCNRNAASCLSGGIPFFLPQLLTWHILSSKPLVLFPQNGHSGMNASSSAAVLQKIIQLTEELIKTRYLRTTAGTNGIYLLQRLKWGSQSDSTGHGLQRRILDRPTVLLRENRHLICYYN